MADNGSQDSVESTPTAAALVVNINTSSASKGVTINEGNNTNGTVSTADQRRTATPVVVQRSFGTDDRFREIPDEIAVRPHAYVGFTSLLDIARGRAISDKGTFSTGTRTSLGSRPATEVAFYEYNKLAPAKHSRGVKRTEQRFRYLLDETSPGPIYKPYDTKVAVGAKFSRAARFPYFNEKAQQQKQLRPPRPTSTSPTRNSDDGRKSADAGKQGPIKCTFGIRHEHLDYKPPGTAEIASGPEDVLTHIPAYTGKFGKSTRSPAKESLVVTPGPGHFFKMEYKAATPNWTFGRRRPDSRAETPGPGAYHIDKFKPVNKPKGETFGRTTHDITFGLPGKDSPGPAVYAPNVFPKK